LFFFYAERLIAVLDGFCFRGPKFLQEFEEAGGVEELQVVIGAGALVGAGGADDDDGNFGVEILELIDDLVGREIAQAGVEDNTINGGEALDCLDGLGTAVGRDDVEFRSLDDEFAGGYIRGEFAVDDEKTRSPWHSSMIPTPSGWMDFGPVKSFYSRLIPRM